MASNFSTQGIRNILSFPFEDPKSTAKLAIACALTLACFFIPVVPFLCLLGYYYEIVHRVVIGDGVLALPEWEDWSRLVKNGLKYLGMLLVYAIPVAFVFKSGLLAYFLSVVGMAAQGDNPSTFSILMLFLGMGMMMVSLFAGVVLGLVSGVLQSVGIANLVVRGRFAGAFAFGELWRVFRANAVGYLLSYIFLVGITSLSIFVLQILYMTIVLCAVIPVLWVVGSVYLGLITTGLFARAYREGADRLSQEVVDVKAAI
jgi:hypothetical protein